MAALKCKMCGGQLNLDNETGIAKCSFCGSKQTVSVSKNEEVQNLLNRANDLRINAEFDKAMEMYEKVLTINNAESEAYWGVILCKFGVEYVLDPETNKRIPTCHRTSYDAIVSDLYYENCLKYCDENQRSVYEQEAKLIDEIQKNIIAISLNEEPYDIFICYKETDEDGQRTKDSVYANEIYYELTSKGYKVFYAAITLEDMLGSSYEPIIFAALNSSKVMLSIGTKPEHFNAVWVKNEWSRFLKGMKGDRSKVLIPCYKDMEAYDLPVEFAHLQALDMGKIGFIQDLVRGIDKIFNVKNKTKDYNKDSDENPLLKRIPLFIEYAQFDTAKEFCETVLEKEPENGLAYLYLLMCDLQIKDLEDLKMLSCSFRTNANFKKVLQYCDEELVEKLLEILDELEENLPNTSNEPKKENEDSLTVEEKIIYLQKDSIIADYESIQEYNIKRETRKLYKSELLISLLFIGFPAITIFLLVKRSIDMKNHIRKEKDRIAEINTRYNKLQEVLNKM